MTTTASFVMTAAHAAARLADQVVAYRSRFATALRAAWATAKQTVKTVMSNILATITVEDQHATPGAVPAKIYDVYHTVTAPAGSHAEGGHIAFAVRRPLREGGKAMLYVASTFDNLAGGSLLFTMANGQRFFAIADLTNNFDAADERDFRTFGFTAADIAIASTAINA